MKPVNQDEEWKKEVTESLGRLERAVVGEPETGNTGLVKRVASVERWQRRADVRIASVSGTIVGAWFLIEKFLLK